MHAVRFLGFSKRYGDVSALSDIDLEVQDTTLTAFIGRSGSGKSTLLRAINGLVVPSAGVVEVLGEAIDYNALTALRRRLGYAVQGTGLFPHLSVLENIQLPWTILSPSKASPEPGDATLDEAWLQERVTQLATLLHLDESLLSRFPHALSGGQQQRVGLARAMLLSPALLLLDEPFAALDPLTRMEVQDNLKQLQLAEPCCTLLVTHDMREALRLADRIVTLDQGRIVADATPAELTARYPEMEPEHLLLTLLDAAPVRELT